LARKHCGRQPEWRISLEVLQKKTGSTSPRRVFRAMLREVIAQDQIPDYALVLEEDILRVTPRGVVLEAAALSGPRQPDAGQPNASLPATNLPALASATLEKARRQAEGWDIYALEAEWRSLWARSGRPRLTAPDKAFLGWLAKRLAG
jgi:Replication initiator protein A